MILTLGLSLVSMGQVILPGSLAASRPRYVTEAIWAKAVEACLSPNP